jgi:hypothetical protein
MDDAALKYPHVTLSHRPWRTFSASIRQAQAEGHVVREAFEASDESIC